MTEPDFEIDPMDIAVYVNLDSVRSRDYLDQIRFNLNIDGGRLQEKTKSFTKIIF